MKKKHGKFLLSIFALSSAVVIATESAIKLPSRDNFELTQQIQAGDGVVHTTTIEPYMNVSGDLANMLPSEVPDSSVIQFVKVNKNTLLHDLPLNFNETDITLKSADKNNLAGEIVTTITLTCLYDKDHQSSTTPTDFTTILKGFRTARQTKFIGEERNLNALTGDSANTLKTKKEKDVNDYELRQLVLDNKDAFYTNVPPIDKSNVIIKILQRNVGDGSLYADIRLNKVYNQKGIPTFIAHASDYVGGTVLISGFVKTRTELSAPSFDFGAIWPGVKVPLLDDDVVDETFFKNGMVENQKKMFVDLKKTLRASDITFTNYPNPMPTENIVSGSITLKFILSSEVSTHRDEMTVTFTGFQKQVTELINVDGTYRLGIDTTPSAKVDQTQYVSIIKSNLSKIFRSLPKDYSFDSNVTISNFDNTVVGQVSANLNLKKVYTNSSVLDTKVTITGFKTTGITTGLVDPTKTTFTLGGVNGILASEITDTQVSENAVKLALLPSFKRNIKDLNEIRPNSLTTSDIRLQVLPNTANNTIGEVQVIVHLLNYKAWVNGTPQEDFTFDDTTFTLNGFKIQKSTAQSKTIIDAGSFANENADKLTKQQAKTLIESNLSIIFNRTLPEDATIRVDSVTPDIPNATCTVVFIPNKIFNIKGIKVANSTPFTINVQGFSNNYTGIISNTITLNTVSNVYSIDSSLDQAWVKSELTPDMFKYLPSAPWNFNDNVSVTNVRNTWTDPSVAFGSLRFDITMTKVDTASGVGTASIYDVEFTGFKTYPATTICTETEINDEKSLGSVLPSDVFDNLSLHKDKIINAIMKTQAINPIFTNLIPGTSLNYEDITIDSVANPDNKIGSLVVNGSISQEIAWTNGKKTPLKFTLLLKGFAKTEPTTWKPDVIISKEPQITTIFARDFSNALAKQFVLEHQTDFFVNVPSGFNPERDITVTVSQPENSKGIAYIIVSLSAHNDINGNPSSSEFMHTFTIKGFLKPDNAATSLKIYDLRNLAFRGYIDNEGHKGFWTNMSPWIADIMADSKVYEDSLLEWLKQGNNATLIFDHYSINGRKTTPRQVEIAYSSQSKNSIDVIIYLDNVSIGNDQYQDNKSFTLRLSSARATPEIDISSTLPGGLMESLVSKYGNDVYQFKLELATLFYDGLCSQVHANAGINFPNVVIQEFPETGDARDEMIVKIMDIIKINGSTRGTAPIESASIDSKSLGGIFPNVKIEKLNLSLIPEQVFTTQNSWITIIFFGGVIFAAAVLIWILIIYFKKVRRIHENRISKY